MSHHSKEHTEHAPKKEENAFDLLLPALKRAVEEKGYALPTPIQAQAIPHIIRGHDLIGCAQTGTGKTAAFTLPILQYLDKHKHNPISGKPRILILAPTRELAAQIGESVSRYGKHLRISFTVIFGGVGQQPQVNAVRRGVHILIATPGRLLDLMEQGFIRLDQVEIFVLDEADRMLDMGFIHDIRTVIQKLPAKRQTLFFSATMEPAVMTLARSLVHEPVHVAIEPEKPAVDRIVQKIYFVDKPQKDDLLISLLKDTQLDRVILFTRTKRDADKVARKLTVAGIRSAAIHGNKSQGARTEALSQFKSGRVRVLVATDIAARGLDVRDISHVINYHLPNEPETYVHRIGRTARAGADGDAISFCSADERSYLHSIERLIRKPVPYDPQAPFHSEVARNASGASARPKGPGYGKGNFQRSSRSSRVSHSAPRASSTSGSSRDRWTKRPAAGRPSGNSRHRSEGFSRQGRSSAPFKRPG